MKHLIRFTSIALIWLFAGTSTLVRTSERVRIEAVGWSPASFTQHLSPASPANLQGMPESQAATASTAERNKALVLKWSDALRNKDMATAQALDKSVADSDLEQEIVLLDEEFEDYRRHDQAGEQMLADDYIGVPVSGRTLDKAGTIELFRSGRVQTKSLKISGRNVRLYGDTAVVIVTRHLNDAISGISRQEQHRCTKVWVKRNGRWQVVSFQATKIAVSQ